MEDSNNDMGRDEGELSVLPNSQFDGIKGIKSSQDIPSRGNAGEGNTSKGIPRANGSCGVDR